MNSVCAMRYQEDFEVVQEGKVLGQHPSPMRPSIERFHKSRQDVQNPTVCINEEMDECVTQQPITRKFAIPGSPDSVTVNIYCNTYQLAKESRRIALVLDVDECLIHSKFLGNSGRYRQEEDRPDVDANYHDTFEITMDDGEKAIVYKRPGLDLFLRRVSQIFDVYVYSAGLEMYGSAIINHLDPDNTIFKGRFFRDSCMVRQGLFLKDLGALGRDLSRVILVDNNPMSFLPQPRNGIPVPSFYDDAKDRTLEALWTILKTFEDVEDVRPRLSSMFKLHELLAEHRRHIIGESVPDY